MCESSKKISKLIIPKLSSLSSEENQPGISENPGRSKGVPSTHMQQVLHTVVKAPF